jgi:D-glycero-D-manno-heptose 1,7-bisphosphate phosphatase
MTRLLILDLDGTIRNPISNPTGFIINPFDQALIDGAVRAIERYKNDGYTLIGATNQGGVAGSHKSLEDCIIEQAHTLELAGLESVFFCPDHRGKQCYQVLNSEAEFIAMHEQDDRWIGKYRKPNAGTLHHAIEGFKGSDILFVGDRDVDEAAANAAGVEFIWARDWWE